MRRSPKRHNLARLRLFLKLGQKELAKVCGCSVHTIQSVELAHGRLALSELLAYKISNATGISAEWLLANDLKAPLMADDFNPFTVEHYNQRRADLELGTLYEKRRTQRSRGIVGPIWELTTIVFYSWMRAIFATNDGNIAFWQMGKFLEQLAKKYGHNRRILSTPRLEWAALRNFNALLQHADSGAKFITEQYEKLRETEGVVSVKMESWKQFTANPDLPPDAVEMISTSDKSDFFQTRPKTRPANVPSYEIPVRVFQGKTFIGWTYMSKELVAKLHKPKKDLTSRVMIASGKFTRR
jgi:transcriptional regulator with XRE-family HTH domain